MRILTRYYVSRFVGLFVMTLVAALLILTTIELVLNLDDLSSFGTRPAVEANALPDAAKAATSSAFEPLILKGALRYLAIRMTADYLTELFPIASFLAMFLTFAWAGRTLEIVVLQAGGIRLIRVVAPVLGVALILSLAAALAHETIVLRARQVWSQEMQLNRDPIELDKRTDRRAFWHHSGRAFANIAYADPETRTLHRVEIFERGPEGRIARVIRADRVRIAADGAWLLESAAIWRFSEDEASARPHYSFAPDMLLDLSTLGGDALLGADPGVLSIAELSTYLEKHGDQKTSRLRQIAVRYHERLSSPWLVLAFAFLALPFALAVDQSGRFSRPAAAAVATLGAFFLVRSAGITLAHEDLIPSAFAAWLPLALILIGATLALRRRWTR